MMIIQIKYKALLFLLGLVSSAAWYGCKDNVDLPDQPLENYINVYMPQGINGPVTANLKVKENLVQTVVFGADYGGYGFPDTDVPVSFAVDNSLVAVYNAANKTSYQVLPAASYSMSANNAVIPQGKLATEPLKISFKTTGNSAMTAFTTYLLPVTVSCPTVKVRESLKTVYYVVRALPDLADYQNFDRSKFSIVDFSSQEANGEGPNNGRAVFVLDGVNTTFWHSQWQNGTASPPHYLTVDMGELKTFHGLSFLARQSGDDGKPNEVNLKLSSDNVTWTDYGTLNLANTQALQSVFFSSAFNKQAKYFKITINSSYGSGVTHLAELYAF